MAGPDRQTADALIAALADKPYEYNFYSAVRLLQCCFPDQPRIGYSTSPTQDPVRFAQSPALDFAPATLEAFKQKDPSRPPVMYSRHFGLFGPNGPMPLCLSEYVRERILHHGDATFAAFCNVFHHRLTSFFFRAWADAQKATDFDRSQEEHWSHFVGALIGLGMDSLLDCDSVPNRAKLYFSGRLVQQNRNADGLAAIVGDFFGVPTEVQSFMGRWLDLTGDRGGKRRGYTCKLGESASTGTLGSSLIIGSRFWTCHLHFRLRMGPMNLADLERLLPGGSSFKRLCDWIRQYVGEELTWDAQIVLRKEEVPKIQLGKAGLLGWTSWLKTKPFERDPADLVLTPH
jgi:type VI secretion system protein ImpH